MNHFAVKSKVIASLGYEPATHTLEVRFKNGATYSYAGVSPNAYHALKTAPSIGGHFTAHISGKFNHRKIG
jgi:KTSC domain-containing protein